MKSSFLAALLFCACLTSFRAQAISYEYDWVGDSPSALYSGSILLDAPSNPLPDGTIADIVSYNITANGINFTGANSGIGSLLPFFEWTPSTITIMDLTITNLADTVILSLTADATSGTGIPQANGEWDAPSSVPDAANTLPLLALALVALGLYYNRLSRPQPVVAIRRQDSRIRRLRAGSPHQNRF
jgi:hypothetical protein